MTDLLTVEEVERWMIAGLDRLDDDEIGHEIYDRLCATARVGAMAVEWKLAEKDREIEKLRGENYSDLLDQMDEAWGNAREIGRVELNAFIETRRVHVPTTRLRAALEQAERRVGELEKAIQESYAIAPPEQPPASEKTPGGKPCKYGDPLCPCQDGDACHYEGENPMTSEKPEREKP